MESTLFDSRVNFSIATEHDRAGIYQMRHAVYAEELGQHSTNTVLQLKDDLDDFNVYIVAKKENIIVGFISVTPADAPSFSIDKYISRSIVPVPFDNFLFEIRLLTVDKANRNSFLALLLMYAAMRWIEVEGGKYIVAICRSDIMDMYKKAGLQPLGQTIKSGQVSYELSIASIEDVKRFENRSRSLFSMLEKKIVWDLPFQFTGAKCFHGGAFFKAIGEDFKTLNKHKQIINADVLDAWFPPSPKVVDAIQQHLPWLLQTSPPTHADGLIDAISAARNVKRNCILPGAGSSSLIFLTLRYLLNQHSRVLIIDPCYGEYVHVLENVIRCHVYRFKLSRQDEFVVNIHSLIEEVKNGYDLIIIVNPNSPTGKYIDKEEMEELLFNCKNTLVWVDETYIDYVGANNSLEQLAAKSNNLIICKSMSKVYSLSGVRAAYLCCSPMYVEALKHLTPPWSLSLPSQLAAVTALNDEAYYNKKYEETHVLRNDLIQQLRKIGITEIITGVANFILFFLPDHFPDAQTFVEKCKTRNLFLRDVKAMGNTLGEKAVRIAVKDGETNKQMIAILKDIIGEIQGTPRVNVLAKIEEFH